MLLSLEPAKTNKNRTTCFPPRIVFICSAFGDLISSTLVGTEGSHYLQNKGHGSLGFLTSKFEIARWNLAQSAGFGWSRIRYRRRPSNTDVAQRSGYFPRKLIHLVVLFVNALLRRGDTFQAPYQLIDFLSKTPLFHSTGSWLFAVYCFGPGTRDWW